jgi:hypothetical protein
MSSALSINERLDRLKLSTTGHSPAQDIVQFLVSKQKLHYTQVPRAAVDEGGFVRLNSVGRDRCSRSIR